MRPRLPTHSATCRRSSPRFSTSTRSSSVSVASSSSKRTGRSRARTFSSATTAPSRTRASAPPSTCRRTPTGSRRKGSFLADGEVPRSQFHFLWPNFGLNVFPGHPNLSCGPMLPIGPERTARFLDYFFAPDVDQEWIDELLAFDNQVGTEDRSLVEGVQRGVRSGILREGHVLSESEQLVAHFQRLCVEALAG